MERAVSMRSVETVAKQIQSKHVLMAFDSCFSGAIFQTTKAKPSPYIEEKVSFPVRQFITAGTEEETVPDRSVFKDVFIQGIKDRFADLNRDGYVTGEELGSYLQEKVINYSNKQQHPQYGKINNPKLDKGDFVFASAVMIHEPGDGRLTVGANVSGAWVKINGEEIGKTPLRDRKMKPGSYRMEVGKAGYRTERRPIEIEENRSLSVTVIMEPEKPSQARLYVDTDPADARVRILNIGPKFYQGMALDPGEYHVEVSAENHETKEERVTLAAGEEKRLDVRLPPVLSEPRPGEIWREPVTGMELVWVPEGCYQMGCGSWTGNCDSDEKPVHEVCVDGFWMGKYEVTQGEWQKVMGSNPYSFKKGENYPVETVSWEDAKEFIRKLNSRNGGRFVLRLPTEAEWEYACRSGGKQEKYSGGGSVDQVAWYGSNSGGSTHLVGSKAANGLGIYDMSGNIWEWCEDIYASDAYSKHSRSNPIYNAGGSRRVIRGGSWNFGPADVRCANRGGSEPAYRGDRLGFRLLRTR